MNEIKYESVFGDQSLFDNATSDSVAIINNGSVVFYFDDYDKFLIEVMKRNDLPLSYIPEFAMRRIVKTPVWTVADWKAGKLPEVGCKCAGVLSGAIKRVVHVNKHIVAVEHEEKLSVCNFTHEEFFRNHEPIETPAEKAQRLKVEWCKSVREQYYPRSYLSFESQIYDALLSGELKAPRVNDD